MNHQHVEKLKQTVDLESQRLPHFCALLTFQMLR